jgi:hypothetical protein
MIKQLLLYGIDGYEESFLILKIELQKLLILLDDYSNNIELRILIPYVMKTEFDDEW